MTVHCHFELETRNLKVSTNRSFINYLAFLAIIVATIGTPTQNAKTSIRLSLEESFINATVPAKGKIMLNITKMEFGRTVKRMRLPLSSDEPEYEIILFAALQQYKSAVDQITFGELESVGDFFAVHGN